MRPAPDDVGKLLRGEDIRPRYGRKVSRLSQKFLQEYSTLIYAGSHGFAQAYRRLASIDGEECLCNDIAWKGKKGVLHRMGSGKKPSLKKQNLHNLKITFGHFIRDGNQGLR